MEVEMSGREKERERKPLLIKSKQYNGTNLFDHVKIQWCGQTVLAQP